MNIQIIYIPILIYLGLIAYQLVEANTIRVPPTVFKEAIGQEVNTNHTTSKNKDSLKLLDGNNSLIKKHDNILSSPQNSSETNKDLISPRLTTKITKQNIENVTQYYEKPTKKIVQPLKLFGSVDQAVNGPNISKPKTETKSEHLTKMNKFTKVTRPRAKHIPSTPVDVMPLLAGNLTTKSVYKPWALTLGNIFMDKDSSRSRDPVNPNPSMEFNPATLTMSTVCLGSTIPYGDHKIMKWLSRHVYKRRHSKRPFYDDLRRQMFFEGNSEECHSPNFTSWDLYQNCALRRNQRMEYKVPHYPVHQVVKT